MSVRILEGDCLSVMPTLEADSIDAIVTDPPYHLTTGKKGGSGPASLNINSPAGRARIGTGFMGKAWDGSITSDSSARQSTSASTPGANSETELGGSRAACVASSSPSTASTGTSPAKAGRSTGGAVPATSRRSSGQNRCGDCGAEYRKAGHPTVKPLDLMQWLCRLVTPKGGTILDPFCGSGSTGRAAVAEGFSFIGIELDHEYAEIARARIADYAPLFNDPEAA